MIPKCPQCREGKCPNCDGIALDPETDNFVTCECRHGKQPEPVLDVEDENEIVPHLERPRPRDGQYGW